MDLTQLNSWMILAKDIKKEFHYNKSEGKWYWSDRGVDMTDWYGPFDMFDHCLFDVVEPYL